MAVEYGSPLRSCKDDLRPFSSCIFLFLVTLEVGSYPFSLDVFSSFPPLLLMIAKPFSHQSLPHQGNRAALGFPPPRFASSYSFDKRRSLLQFFTGFCPNCDHLKHLRTKSPPFLSFQRPPPFFLFGQTRTRLFFSRFSGLFHG